MSAEFDPLTHNGRIVAKNYQIVNNKIVKKLGRNYQKYYIAFEC